MAGDGSSSQKISFTGLQWIDDAGKPELPVKLVRLALPQGQQVKSISITERTSQMLSGTFRVVPIQPSIPIEWPTPIPSFQKGDSLVYNSDEEYPASPIRVLHSDFLDENFIVTLAVYPLQYRPRSGQLKLNTSVEFVLDLEPYSGDAPRVVAGVRSIQAQEMADRIARDIVDNPGMISLGKGGVSTWTGIAPSGAGLPTYEYVIITADSLATAFDAFVAWKNRKGIRTGVVTTSDIYGEYSGDLISGIYDDAGKIRHYLSDAHAQGIPSTTWALLAGDHTIVPVRYGAGYDGCDWGANSVYKIPSELYFADFSGDWNVNGDVRYGEPHRDSPDYLPEIHLGRLPCTCRKDVENWVKKVLSYECNPGRGDASYLGASFWFRGIDLEDLDPNVTANLLPATISKTIWWDYEGHTGTAIVNKMSQPYGLLNWYAHGQPTYIGVLADTPGHCLWSDDNGWRDDPPYASDLIGDGLNQMTNRDRYSSLYAISCHVAGYDDFNYIHSPFRSLAEAFLCETDAGGGPAFLANSRYGWEWPSTYIHQYFWNHINSATPSDETYFHLGVSEDISRYEYSGTGYYGPYLSYSHNMYGCPETELWTAAPQQLSSVQVTDNGSTVQISTGVSECTITATSGDAVSYFSTQSHTSSYTFNTSVRPLYVTVTKHNYIPYAAVTGGTFTSNQIWFENLRILGNLTTGTGTTLTVQPGSKISFSSGVSLTINGTLSAAGATFDRSGTSGQWGGIIFNSGSTGSLSGCTLQNAGWAIKCTNVLPSITNCQFTANNIGLYLSNVGSPSAHLSGNHFTSTGGTGQGIACYPSSSPYIDGGSTFSGLSMGIFCLSSAPRVSSTTFTGNTTGIYAINNSAATIGGYNRFTGNATAIYADASYNVSSYNCDAYQGVGAKAVYATNNAQVIAQNNYWGQYPPNPAHFQALNGAIIYYQPGSSSPWTGPLGKMALPDVAVNTTQGAVDSSGGSMLTPALMNALLLLREGKAEEARTVYLDALKAASNTQQKKYILGELAECYRVGARRDFSEFLSQEIRPNIAPMNELYATTLELENLFLIPEGAYQKAIDNLMTLKAQSIGSESREKSTLFNLWYIYAELLGDKAKGKVYFDELFTKYPDDILTSQAKLLQQGPDSLQVSEAAKKKDQIKEVPDTWVLFANYPNPFNPATTIRYGLPENAAVKLTIYNVLGQQVAVLVDGIQAAGYHEAVWNGMNVASGVYYARFTVIDELGAVKFQKVSKLLLMK